MKNKMVSAFCAVFAFILISVSLTACDMLDTILEGDFVPTTEQMVAALKEALTKGSVNAGDTLSKNDAFYANLARKIPLPDEVNSMMTTLNDIKPISVGIINISPNTVINAIGGDQAISDLVLRINRAAEESSKEVGGIFGNAVKSMTFADAASILKGTDTAATEYFKLTTTNPLKTAFSPKLDAALDKKIVKNISALSAWNDVVNPYNDFAQKYNSAISNILVIAAMGQQTPLNIVETNLSEFVLDKALTAVFNEIGVVEKEIRADPIKFLSDVSKKVFDWAKK